MADRVDIEIDQPQPQNGRSTKVANGGKPKLQKERISRSLVYPEDDGIQQQTLSATPNCNICKDCNDSCCENGVCQQSKRNKSARPNAGNVEMEPCCSTKKKKSFFRRKSTNVFLSGICMLAVTGISIADIATDVLTAREYYSSERYTAFTLSLVFLIVPPILLTAGMIRRRDDTVRNTTAKTISCCGKFLIFILNVPLKLYMIWLQLVFAYRCFKRFHNWRKSRCLSREDNLMGGTLSHYITELTLYKLWNSIFESMPQLLLTIHVIMTESDLIGSSRGYLLILSSAFSFGSLCVGIIYYAIKAKEAESKSKKNNNSTKEQLQLRAKSTVLDIPQIVLISVYTVCFLGSRTTSLSYFILFFGWYSIIVPGIHWIAVFLFFAYRRYVNQKPENTMQHYRVQTYSRRSSSFVYVFVHSVMSVFIHIKPEVEEVLDQPRYYKIIFYFFYTLENCFMILLPLLLKEIARTFPTLNVTLVSPEDLDKYEYYTALYVTLTAMALACFTCALYHFVVHKASSYTREQVFGPCCRCCFGPGGFLCWSCSCCCCCDKDDSKIYVTCKNIQTHEIHKTSLKDIKIWKQSTESELLNNKPLRAWKIRLNEFRDSTKKSDRAGDADPSSETSSSKSDGQGNDGPYTMRRSGLNILSDPQGRLFYAPISELKTRTIPITY